jgi:hypothetical protein
MMISIGSFVSIPSLAADAGGADIGMAHDVGSSRAENREEMGHPKGVQLF